MSNEHYNWWPFALNMIRDYPMRILAKQEGELYGQALREWQAVHKAERITMGMADGKTRLQVVRLTEWQRTHTIAGAADQLHLSYSTAKRYRWRFIALVGNQYGLLSDGEYHRAIHRDNP